MAQARLPQEVRAFIVHANACFDYPSAVVEAVKKEFGVDVTRQHVEAHDPTKKAGVHLAPRWKEVFEAARQGFLNDTSAIAISHRAVRLRALQRMSQRAEEMRNLPLAATLLEQAAKEVGDAYTNRRELTGKGGAPIQTETRFDLSSLSGQDRDALRAILERRAGGPDSGPQGA